MYAKLGFRVAGATAGGALLATALGRDELKGSKLSLDVGSALAPAPARAEQSLSAFIDSNRYAGVLSPALGNCRFNELMPSPGNAEFKLAVVEFNVPGAPRRARAPRPRAGRRFASSAAPRAATARRAARRATPPTPPAGAKNGGTDKGPNGHRIDSIPIANGVIKAGGACEIKKYFYDQHDAFAMDIEQYDALIVRINPGQLSQIPGVEGVQAKFDALMNKFVASGRPVWSSPGVQTKMGAKDALCKIANMGCGLVDTLAYYAVWKSTAGLGRPDQTLKFSSSATSKSIRRNRRSPSAARAVPRNRPPLAAIAADFRDFWTNRSLSSRSRSTAEEIQLRATA